MPDSIGDIIMPREFIIPTQTTFEQISGNFFLSGNYAYILTKDHLYQLSGSVIF